MTAFDRADAEQLLVEQLDLEGLPFVQDVVQDIDVRDLDENHVRPNLSDPSTRGVWFPGLMR